MKILLVNPPRFQGIPVIREERCEITDRYSVLEPYSLLQIASMLRQRGHHISLMDANGWNMPYQKLETTMTAIEYDVLIFRFTPTTFDHDMKTAELSKKINPTAVTTGICWTLRTLAEKVLTEAKKLDIYIMHEYEVVTPILIDSISKGIDLSTVNGIAYREKERICVNQPSKPIKNYDLVPLPAYDLLPNLDNYFINTPAGQPFTIMYTSKGCPFKCIYCTVAGTIWKARSAESVIKELRFLKNRYGIKTVSFFDETFTIDRERVVKIVDGLKKENVDITWYCNTRANLVDKALLKIMRDGGCKGMSLGIESGSQKILDNVDKKMTVNQAENAIKWVKETGIKTYCSFIFGLPGETWETIDETINFVKRALPTSAQFNVAVPYPGTELYDLAIEKGWVRNIDWRKLYQDDAIMRTDVLTTEDLDTARKMAYRALYFNPRWVLQNIGHVIKNPEDLELATKYWLKVMNNYLIHKMKHAH